MTPSRLEALFAGGVFTAVDCVVNVVAIDTRVGGRTGLFVHMSIGYLCSVGQLPSWPVTGSGVWAFGTRKYL
ncbi:hypothetical protein F4802DRAFT_568817 [Xylaria palmicola]|nr:hypothetical protein F4802DRAFT_568817 [Xylaria palmicola]